MDIINLLHGINFSQRNPTQIIMILKRNEMTARTATWGEPRHPYHFAAPGKSKGQPSVVICHADVSQPNQTCSQLGHILVEQSVSSLAWQASDKHGMGLLVTGSEQGVIALYDPAAISSSSGEFQAGLIIKEEAFQNEPITTIEFNALKNNLIAVGSSEVLIVDIKRGGLDIFSAGENNPHEGYFVSKLAWNKKIDKILASAGQNGQVVFWDVLANKYIFQLEGEQSQSHKHMSMAWNPFIPTQIALASDDDLKKELLIWDLRNTRGPILRIDKGYSRGITSLDWSPLDHNLLLASSKDNKIICWNLGSDCQIVSDCSTHDTIHDIRWNRKVPSVFLASSATASEVYCLSEKDLHSHAPQWYKPTVCFTTGLNNTAYCYSLETHSLSAASIGASDQSLAQEIELLDRIMEHDYCPDKDFYRAVGLGEEGADKVLQFLMFQRGAIIKDAQNYTGKKHGLQTSASQQPFTGFSTLSDVEADSFFESLGKKPEPAKIESSGNIQPEKMEFISINKNWNIGKQSIIKQNLLVGNFVGAVDVAMKCGRMAEGLVIAYSQGMSLFESTLKTFFTETTEPFITDVLKNLVQDSYESLIDKYDLPNWRQCLAILVAKGIKNRKELVTQLAKRLLKDKMIEQALICLAIVQNYEMLYKVLWENVCELQGTVRQKELLKATARITYCFKRGTVSQQSSPELQNLLLQTGLILLDQSKPELALSTLRMANSKRLKIISFINKLASSQGETIKEKFVAITPMKKEQKQLRPKHQAQKTRPTFGAGQSRPSAPPSVYKQSTEEPAKRGPPPPPPKSKMPPPPIVPKPEFSQMQQQEQIRTVYNPSAPTPPPPKKMPPPPSKPSSSISTKPELTRFPQEKKVNPPPPKMMREEVKVWEQAVEQPKQDKRKMPPPVPVPLPSPPTQHNRPMPPPPRNVPQTLVKPQTQQPVEPSSGPAPTRTRMAPPPPPPPRRPQ